MPGERRRVHNLYLCERDLGQRRSATNYLRAYLDEAGDVPNRALLQRRLTELETQVAADATSEEQAARLERELDEQRAAPSRTGPTVLLISAAAVGVAAAGLAVHVTYSVHRGGRRRVPAGDERLLLIKRLRAFGPASSQEGAGAGRPRRHDGDEGARV